MADDDGLISGLTEDQLITNEEMDALVKEVRRADVRARSRVVPSPTGGGRTARRATARRAVPVSYTHLTLPTILLV